MNAKQYPPCKPANLEEAKRYVETHNPKYVVAGAAGPHLVAVQGADTFAEATSIAERMFRGGLGADIFGPGKTEAA